MHVRAKARVALCLGVLLLAQPARAQETARLTADEAVRRALEQSPAVTAAESRVEAAAAGVRGARAPFNPQAELAPGVGFTNGNSVLSQQFDIGGLRSAQAQAAMGLRTAAEAELELTRLQVAGQASTAYHDLVRARSAEEAARETAQLARQLRDAVRHRVEIGEAPQVQLTRAEIEVTRAEQEVARAAGDVRGRQTTLNVLLGRPADTPTLPAATLAVPEAPAPTAELLQHAQQARPELAVGRGLLEARRGDVAVARAQRRPELFTDVAADTWSLDRDPFGSRNLGFQVRLSFPILDRGRLRSAEDRARAGVRAQEAELEATRRALTLDIEQAAAELSTAREVALNYETAILPRTQELLRATQAGFETGLSSFLEVLEAQRVARQTRTEYQSVLFEAVRARINLERALGRIPGLTPTPGPNRSPTR